MIPDESFISEIEEFSGVSADEIRRKFENAQKKYPGFLKWTHVSEEEWKAKKIDQNDEKSVARFYSETLNYILELAEYHSTKDKQALTPRAVSLMLENGTETSADYGCGIGQDAIMHSLAGINATAVDLPGKTFDFAKFRFKKRGLEIKTIDIEPGNLPLEETYNAITCFEVMQHLTNPERVLAHFHKHISPSGLFLMTARFQGNYALALGKNEKYEGHFKEAVENAGFLQEQRIHMWGPNNEKGKYLEVYRK